MIAKWLSGLNALTPKLMTGNLPSSLRIIATKPRKVEIDWDDSTEESTLMARAAYVSDETNETTIERGREWARSYRHAGVSKEFTVPNTPNFTADTRIVGLEKRAEGGRAWKVVVKWEDETYLFDLREDTLLQEILGPGIGEGGAIKSPLVWGKVGSQMKLIRVGSDIYTELVEANKVDKTKPPKATDLKVGDVWESKNGDRAAFLGWVSIIEMDHEPGYYGEKDITTLVRVPRIQAWHSLPAYEKSLQKAFDEYHWFQFGFKKSCSYRKLVGKVKVPADWIARVEDKVREEWATKQKESWNRDMLRLANHMSCYCRVMHLGAPGEVVPLKKEWKPWAHLLK